MFYPRSYLSYDKQVTITLDNLQEIRKKHAKQSIVLTSGTFDLLHVGHLNYLERVKEHGDVVIVLLSSDQRVKARKGSKRPIINENDRFRIHENLKKLEQHLPHITVSIIIKDENNVVGIVNENVPNIIQSIPRQMTRIELEKALQ